MPDEGALEIDEVWDDEPGLEHDEATETERAPDDEPGVDVPEAD